MDIIDHLKPKYVLMENVVDIVKFANGFLGRYAVGRLIGMNYQARLGIMAAGSYGLPQFRLRVFLWGAHISKVFTCPLKIRPISNCVFLNATHCHRDCPNILCQLMRWFQRVVFQRSLRYEVFLNEWDHIQFKWDTI